MTWSSGVMARLGILLVVLLARPGAAQEQQEARVSCSPGGSLGPSACTARGCLWSPVADPGVPWCHFPDDWGYTVVSRERREGSTVVRLSRVQGYRSGPPTTAHLHSRNLTLFGDDFPDLLLTVTEESDARLRVGCLGLNQQ